jgi:hypothetical protein
MAKSFSTRAARISLLIVGAVVTLLLTRAWRQQTNATLTCEGAFGQLAEHNGYVQVDLLRRHPTDAVFRCPSVRPVRDLGISTAGATTYA